MARFDSGVRYDSGARYDEPEGNPTPKPSTIISLRRFFARHHDDPEHSLAELIAYGTAVLQRLIANNPGDVCNNTITALTVTLATLAQCSGDDQTKLGIRKAAVLAKDTFRENLPKKLERIEAKIKAAYENFAGEVQACFPNGRNIFNTSTDDQLAERFTPLLAGLATRIPVMGTTAHGDAGGLLSTWIALHAANETAYGNKSATQEEKANAREAFCDQLDIAVLTVAIQFHGDEDKADLYFPQHLLEDHPPQQPQPVNPPTT
jgi:hypothetical protein